jgi:hypothetical protein
MDDTRQTATVEANVPAEEYHRRELGVVSKSALDRLRQSPMHYKAWVDGETDDDASDALIVGSAFHCAMLEPERFAAQYVVAPNFGDGRTKEAKAAKAAWLETVPPNATFISASQFEMIDSMVASVRRTRFAASMLRDGLPELTARWTDPATGLRCKVRADYYVERHGMIVDVKSTGDASPEEFARSVAKYGYHRQDALYRAGFAAAGKPVRHFVLVCVEKTPPFGVALYEIDEDGSARGIASVTQDMWTLAECMRTNEWPGYPEEIQPLAVPKWAA